MANSLEVRMHAPCNAIVELRRRQAAMLSPVLDILGACLGQDRGRAAILFLVRRLAVRDGRTLRWVFPEGHIDGLVAAWERFQECGSLDLEFLERTANSLHVRVTRCRYAEMYRAQGMCDVGRIWSCSRDAPFLEGFDDRLTLHRSATILDGSPCCDFRYAAKAPAESPSGSPMEA